MAYRKDWEPMIENLALDSELRSLVASTLDAIERAIVESEGFARLPNIMNGEGFPFPGLPPDIGFIPGKGKGPCPRVLVGIATAKPPNAKYGAVSVMRQIRDVLIKCCDSQNHSKTEVVIFISPLTPIDSVMNESVGDIEGHMRKGILKAFIPIGVLRDRISVLRWN